MNSNALYYEGIYSNHKNSTIHLEITAHLQTRYYFNHLTSSSYVMLHKPNALT